MLHNIKSTKISELSLGEKIFNEFQGKEFTLKEAYKAIPDKPQTTVRGRIYDNLDTKFERLDKGVYRAIKNNSECLILQGDGRDLTCMEDKSIDAIVTDHPWSDPKSTKGGNRNFTETYNCFCYQLKDFQEKCRVLKDGAFLVEILPAENESNFHYLYNLKKIAGEAGLMYYAKVSWKKGKFISNTGRKSKNTEDIMFFTKGKARNLRIDVKKTNKTGMESFMSGTNKMLPTMFDIESVSLKTRIHQAEKPVELYEAILDYITQPGEIVLDQFAGSGNAGIACLNKQRNCILIELLQENIEKIKERIRSFIENPVVV